MAIEKGKAGQDIFRDEKGQISSLAKMMKKTNETIEEQSKKSTMTLKELKESVEKGTKLNENVTDETKDIVERMNELTILGFNKADAEAMARNTARINQLKQDRQILEEMLQNNNLDVDSDSQIQAIDAQIKSLKGIEDTNKNLTRFQESFKWFSEEKFDDLTKSVEKGGALTGRGIATTLGEDLKSDFDKVLGFLGPAVGLLQQIPLLGTILNLGKNLAKKLFVELFLSRKAESAENKSIVGAIKSQTNILHDDMEQEARENRRARRDAKKRRDSGQAGAGQGADGDTSIEEGDTNVSTGLLGTAMALKTIANPQSAAGVTAFGGSLATLAALPVVAGAGKLAAAIALLGGSVAISIAAVLGSISLGFLPWERNNTAKTLEDISTADIDAGKIAGLIAALGGASVVSAIGGLASTIATFGGAFTPLTDLGNDLSGFATGVSDFKDLKMDKIKSNFDEVKGIIGERGGFWENLFAPTEKFRTFGEDLGLFAEKVKPFAELEMGKFKENMDILVNATTGLELPKFSQKDHLYFNSIAKLGQIDNEGVGRELELMGSGVGMITAGIETLTIEKAKALGKLGSEIKGNFDNFNLNFGVIPQTTGEGLDVSYRDMQPSGYTVMAPQVVDARNTTNVQRQYHASGANPNPYGTEGVLG